MIALNCENLSLTFGSRVVFEHVSFSLNEGDKLGIVGVNGAGKSSLFSVIVGRYSPTDGSVYIGKNKTIGILTQNPDYRSDSTILDEAYGTFSDLIRMESELEDLRKKAESGKTEDAARRYVSLQETFTRLGGYEFRGRCRGILRHLGLPDAFWDKPVTSLSGGQKTRLSLACLLLRDPDILLLDEPTNHLDTETLFWLENHLKASRKTILIISHDRYFLDAVAGHILEIENGKGHFYHGNYSRYQNQKKTDRAIEERHYRNQQKEIRRIEAYIEQQRRWNRERNIIAAESRQKMLDKMEKLSRPDALPDSVNMHFESSGESGNDVMTVRRLAKSYPGKPLFRDLSFEVHKHDHLFICGQNGCGKSTLVKILAGRLSSDSGYIVPGSNVRIGYYDQENQNLIPDNSVLDELWNAYPGLTETVLRSTLARFLFRGEDVEKRVAVLSGGEKARLTLAKLMLSKMNLLILDEPTNHLDIPSREILENALSDFDGTLIAVSHDRYFINKLATRILDFGAGPVPAVFNGTYSDYLEWRKMLRSSTDSESEETKPVMTAAKEQFLNAKSLQAEQRRREHNRQKTQAEIRNCEARIAELNEEINGDEIAYDYVRLAALHEELTACEEKLLQLYEAAESFGDL